MKKVKVLVIFVLLFSLLVFVQGKKQPSNFSEAKEVLSIAWKYTNFTTDFYCQAPFTFTQHGLHLIQSSKYSARNPYTKKGAINARASIVEFEHIMPAYNFGRHLACWKKDGRKACKNNTVFNKMEADLYNLVPAIGEINGDRNNYRYAQSPRNLNYTQYGDCKVYTDFKAKKFYPADYSKGLIARTYLYMSAKYHIRLSNQERQLMESWDRMYPPNEYEKKRNRIIALTLWIYTIFNFFS